MDMKYFYIHLAITLLYFALVGWRVNFRQAAAETILVFSLPVIGFFSLLIWHALCYRYQYRGIRPEDLVEVETTPTMGRMTYQSDIVPLRDMQLISDNKLKRRLFMTAIKQEVVDNPEILREAIHDKDREITYYAVSLMTARAEKISSSLFELEKELKNARDDEEETLLKEYAEKLQEFLKGRYGDEEQREERKKVLLTVLERLAAKLPNQSVYRELSIRLAINLREYSHAEDLIRQARKESLGAENFVRLSLELAVARRDRSGVDLAIHDLKALPIKLSPEALTAIRYWGGAA